MNRIESMDDQPAILVVGGAGYSGSHICAELHHSGFTPVTFDNLSTGHADAVRWGGRARSAGGPTDNGARFTRTSGLAQGQAIGPVWPGFHAP